MYHHSFIKLLGGENVDLIPLVFPLHLQCSTRDTPWLITPIGGSKMQSTVPLVIHLTKCSLFNHAPLIQQAVNMRLPVLYGQKNNILVISVHVMDCHWVCLKNLLNHLCHSHLCCNQNRWICSSYFLITSFLLTLIITTRTTIYVTCSSVVMLVQGRRTSSLN